MSGNDGDGGGGGEWGGNWGTLDDKPIPRHGCDSRNKRKTPTRGGRAASDMKEHSLSLPDATPFFSNLLSDPIELNHSSYFHWNIYWVVVCNFSWQIKLYQMFLLINNLLKNMYLAHVCTYKHMIIKYCICNDISVRVYCHLTVFKHPEGSMMWNLSYNLSREKDYFPLRYNHNRKYSYVYVIFTKLLMLQRHMFWWQDQCKHSFIGSSLRSAF